MVHSSLELITIERHILEQQGQHPGATGRFTNLLYDLALAAKLIARETTRAGIANILGTVGSENVHGEAQQKLDVYADEVIFRMNDHTGRVCVMASEEHDELRQIPEHHTPGYYVLIYDPLDGSSNIDVNASIGTIFAIHRKITPGPRGTAADVLQAGNKLVAAAYVVYGSSTMLVYSTGNGVHGFTLDPSVGEFFLSHPDIRIPSPGAYYSVNQGYQKYWTPGIQRYVTWLQALDSDATHEPLGHRYIGSLVSDFHRNLLRGGVYLYPGDTRQPAGKLRLTYEAQPLAFIAAQAGGYASDGMGNILDITPRDLHQRVPFIVGNRALVQKAEWFLQEYDAADNAGDDAGDDS